MRRLDLSRSDFGPIVVVFRDQHGHTPHGSFFRPSLWPRFATGSLSGTSSGPAVRGRVVETTTRARAGGAGWECPHIVCVLFLQSLLDHNLR